MIPVKLSFYGIYSYRDKQEIDFTKLTSAGIFGIFGHVGSGKSAILEAITFALYGETERLNNRERGSNIMNLKSDSLSIEFIFKTSSGTYMTSVSVKRDKKQFYKLQTPDRRAFKQNADSWEPVDYEKIPDIIGISYDNFKRTIIIPQGRFQEFLQLENSKRNLMMKELFHLEKYDLADKTGILEKRNESELENIEGQLKQLGEITPERIELVNVQIDNLTSEHNNALNKQKLLKEKKASFDSLKTLIESYNKSEAKFNSLIKQKEYFDKLEKAINDREYCTAHFKPALDALKSAETKINKYTEELKLKKTESDSLSKDLDTKSTAFSVAEKEYGGKEQYKRKAEELEALIKLKGFIANSSKLRERIEKGKNECLKLKNEIDSKKTERTNLSEELKKQKLSLPDTLSLSNAANWFANNTSYINDLDSFVKEQISVKNEITNLISEKNNLFKNNNLKDLSTIENFAKSAEFIEEIIAKMKKDIELITKEADELNTSKKISDYASNLHDGEPCPLCGSKEHPSPALPENIAERISDIKEKKDGLEKYMDNLNFVLTELSKIDTLMKAKKEELHKAENKIEKQNNKIDEHKKLFIWNDLKDDSTVKLKLEEAEKIKNTITDKEKCLDNLNSEIEKLEEKNIKFNEAFGKIQSEYENSNIECERIKGGILLLNVNDYLSVSETDLSAAKIDFLKKYDNAENNYKNAFNERERLTGRIQILSGEISAREDSIKHETSEKDNANKEITAKLNGSKFSSIEEIETILSNQKDISDDKKLMSTYLENFAVAKNEFESLKSQIKGKTYDETLHLQTDKEFTETENLIQSLNREIGKLNGEKLKLAEDSKKSEEISARKDKLLLRKENIKTLKNLFKANGFVDYVSSVYLNNICNSANERFYRLTRQKLSLELTDDNSFIIRDYLNDGKTRSVKTLSGGQTFQAALSLSLALADDIHKISGAEENFFFLDEGFGSLDKDALGIVFDTLKALRKEKRIVGVISHVEDMQEEIDTYLRIENTEQSGSIIKASWNE